jgi:putative tricarboxylic transport membrane protein
MRGEFWLARKDALAGLMFAAVGLFGLWVSRNYPIGTALRMGTGYVPRLLCWVLVGLGGIILIQGLLAGPSQPQADEHADAPAGGAWRPLVLVTASLVAFALSVERLGLVVSILLMTAIGALAARDLRLVETLAAALALVALAWAIFIFGLGLTIPVWPDW